MKRGHITDGVKLSVYEESGGNCMYCKKGGLLLKTSNTKQRAVIDHIVPISNGGKNDIDNLQVLCVSCNAVKKDMTMDDFVSHMKRRESIPTMLTVIYNEYPMYKETMPAILERISWDMKYELLKPIYDYLYREVSYEKK